MAIQELLGGSARLFQARACAANVTIDVQTPDAVITIDAARVRQAVDNLLDNALRHAPPHTAVVLAAEVDDQTVNISVADAGPGIPVAFQESVFRPYVRMPADRGDYEGSGLGLTIVAAVAAGHGGSATVDTEARHGTRIVMALPAVDAA